MNVAIVGLGNIGLGSKNIKNFKSHANFFYKSRHFKLFAVIDKSLKKLNLFKKNFNFKKIIIQKNLNQINSWQNKKIDILCISTPTNQIFSILKKIIKLKLKPSIFLLEKPVAYTLTEFDKIISLIKKNKIIINYQRIFDKNYSKIFKNLKKEKNLYIKITFNNGYYQNLSHILSLLIYYFGKPKNIKQSYNKNNKQFFLNFSNNIKVTFDEINKQNYNVLDMVIYCKNKKISFLSGGHHITFDKIFNYEFVKKYKLLKQFSALKLSQIFSLDFFFSKKYNFLIQKKVIECSRETIKILHNLKKNKI